MPLCYSSTHLRARIPSALLVFERGVILLYMHKKKSSSGFSASFNVLFVFHSAASLLCHCCSPESLFLNLLMQQQLLLRAAAAAAVKTKKKKKGVFLSFKFTPASLQVSRLREKKRRERKFMRQQDMRPTLLHRTAVLPPQTTWQPSEILFTLL